MVERQRQSMADLVEEPAKKTSGQVWVGLTDDEAMELVGAAPGMVRIRAVRTIYPEEDRSCTSIFSRRVRLSRCSSRWMDGHRKPWAVIVWGFFLTGIWHGR